MANTTTNSIRLQVWGFVKKVLFVGGFALTPIAMGGLIQDIDSWGGIYGWLVRAWDSGFRQPVSVLINSLFGWSGVNISGWFVDYLTIGGIVVAAFNRTIRVFPHLRKRMILPWANPVSPSYVRWPLGIALWPVTVGLFYLVLTISVMLLLFLSDRWLGEGEGIDANRADIFRGIAAASAFLFALSLPFILMALDARGSG